MKDGKLRGYDKCRTCVCFYENLAKDGITIQDECSNGQVCHMSEINCHCFSEYVRIRKVRTLKKNRKVSDNTLHSTVKGIIKEAKRNRAH